MAQQARTATRTTGASSLGATLSRRRLVLVVAGVMLAMLLSALDQTIVGSAMPRVIADLGGMEHYAWVFTGYMLASTVMVPIWGKLSDLYGRRPFFLAGMLLFLLGSALSGTSQDMVQLIAFRGIQGIGAGAMLPIVQAIIGDVFPPAQRGKWQGLMMGVFGLASIVGPTAGGWITDSWGWRWVFYVNMPVGALALVTAGIALPRVQMRASHRIDYLGAAALVAASVPMLLAFSWAGTQYPWGSVQILGLLGFSALMWIAFFVRETRAEEPIISPSFFGNSIFTVSVIATFLASMGMFGAIMYIPLFVQGVIGASATGSGAVTTPMMLGFVASSIIGGQVMARTGRYKLLALAGFALAAVGAYLLSQMPRTATEGLVVRNMIVTGLGIGVTMSLFTVVVQNAFPFKQLGQVTASLQFFRSIGGTIGVAILGSVMANSFQQNLQANMPPQLRQTVPAGQMAQLANPQLLLSPQAITQMQQTFAQFGPQGEALLQQLLEAIRVSLTAAITQLFAVSTASMVLALVATLFLKEIPLRRTHYPSEGSGGELAPMGVGLSDDGDLANGERRRAVLGLALALAAREATRPDADRKLLEVLSSAAGTTVPLNWGTERRGRSVAAMVIEPLAAALLASVDPVEYSGPLAVRRALVELGATREMEPDEGDVQEALAVLASALAFDTSDEEEDWAEEGEEEAA